MSKISEYTNSVTAIEAGDLFDVSELISTGPDVYQSRKMTGTVLKAYAQSQNLFNLDGQVLQGAYTHDLNSNQLTFDNGSFRVENGALGVLGYFNAQSDGINPIIASFVDSGVSSVFRVYDDGEVIIGSTPQDSGAVLNITSTTRGLLPPRMSTGQINLIDSGGGTPTEGMFAYDLTVSEPKYYNGSAWTGFGGGSTIYSADDTIGANRVLTLTNNVEFSGGTLNIKGVGTTTGSALGIFNSSGVRNWNWSDNGNVATEQAVTWSSEAVGNQPIVDFSLNRSLEAYIRVTSRPLYPNGVQFSDGTLRYTTGYFNYSDRYGIYNNQTNVMGVAMLDTNEIILSSDGATTSLVGTEDILLNGRTAVKGADLLGTSTAFEVFDSAGTNQFNVRNDGSIYTGGVQGFTGTGAYTNFTITNGIITSAS